MLVTNKIAKFIISIAQKIVHGTQGVTIWPFIFIWPPQNVMLKGLVRHEYKHIEQWTRYWIIGFPIVYLWQFVKYGYAAMPLEQEARNAAQ